MSRQVEYDRSVGNGATVLQRCCRMFEEFHVECDDFFSDMLGHLERSPGCLIRFTRLPNTFYNWDQVDAFCSQE